MSNVTWGGRRAGAGRPPIGETKQIKLTLPEEGWKWIEECVENGHADSRSELLRDIIEFARVGIGRREPIGKRVENHRDL